MLGYGGVPFVDLRVNQVMHSLMIFTVWVCLFLQRCNGTMYHACAGWQLSGRYSSSTAILFYLLLVCLSMMTCIYMVL
jgi:hypothetical protein